MSLVVVARFRDGKQHVDITWQLGQEKQVAASGRARSKKQARREAAKKLLKSLPVGKEAETQMRKQMLQGLRYKLSAEARCSKIMSKHVLYGFVHQFLEHVGAVFEGGVIYIYLHF